MKKVILIAIFALITSAKITYAQTTAASVKISGELTKPLTLTDADLKKYPQVTVMRKDKDGGDHKYSGVLLSDILQSAGVTMGAELRGKNLSKYLIIGANDGYQVVFALPELDKNFTDRQIILADMMDDKPLSATDGPFKVVVPDDKKPARCIRMVTSMRIAVAQ